MSLLSNICGLIVYKLAPINKNRIVFTSFSGHYSDSPKYISESIHTQSPNIEQWWLVQNQYINDVPSWVRIVNINSIKARWIKGTACVVVDNIWCGRSYKVWANDKLGKVKGYLHSFFSSKKKQLAFTTYHGTPLKCLDRDQIGNDIVDFYCPGTELILGNKYSCLKYEHIAFNKVKANLLGTPRNALLFQNQNKNILKSKLNLPLDMKIALFAPTFRNDGKDVEGKNIYRSGLNQLKSIDFDILFETLSKKMCGEWVFVCRFHYHVSELIDWNKIEQQYNGRIINGNKFDDMAEYLACSDLLITDYSSSMFDFMLTGKPCFLYLTDLDFYRNKERGFYLNIEDLPFPRAIDFNSLIETISHFDENKYKELVQSFILTLGCIDDSNSASRVAKYILERMKDEKND